MKKIAVLTSGGDAPGMNACLRAVVRTSLYQNVQVVGIKQGYDGLIAGNFIPMDLRSVANIIQLGGTVLKTGRSQAFLQAEGRRIAAHNLKNIEVDGLVVIGGDGSFRGAKELHTESGLPVVGIPGTIDNDISGTEETIGFDTAINTAVDAIDRIRDTAFSHDRIFIVEVMGRNSGFLASEVGLAGGAEQVIVPEFPVDIEKIAKKLSSSLAKGKLSSIIVLAEGQKPGRAYDLVDSLRKKLPIINPTVCILGHIQRGGKPSAHDRNLASLMGSAAVNHLLSAKSGHGFVAVSGGKYHILPLDSAFTLRPLRSDLIKLTDILSQ